MRFSLFIVIWYEIECLIYMEIMMKDYSTIVVSVIDQNGIQDDV